jgi:hypothetical protein
VHFYQSTLRHIPEDSVLVVIFCHSASRRPLPRSVLNMNAADVVHSVRVER